MSQMWVRSAKKRDRAGKGDGVYVQEHGSLGRGAAGEGTFEARPEEGEGGSHAGFWGTGSRQRAVMALRGAAFGAFEGWPGGPWLDWGLRKGH